MSETLCPLPSIPSKWNGLRELVLPLPPDAAARAAAVVQQSTYARYAGAASNLDVELE